MSAPVANVTPTSVQMGAAAHGTFTDVTVSATDADNLSGNVTFPVTDSQGNTASATVTLNVSDALTFGAPVVPAAFAGKVTVSRISVAADGLSAVYRVTVV